MIRDLKCFYVAIKNNEIVCYDTNLKLFLEKFGKMVPDLYSYSYYSKNFKKTKIIPVNTKQKETYYLQKVI